MDGSSGPSVPLAGATKRLLHRLVVTGENRFQLLAVEVQEERNRLLDMVFLAVAIAALGLLVGIALGAALVICFWQSRPVVALLLLGAVYAVSAMALCWRLIVLRRQQQTLVATLDQLRKDRACFKEI
jgi:uncharacterized membrane protein YqjE